MAKFSLSKAFIFGQHALGTLHKLTQFFLLNCYVTLRKSKWASTRTLLTHWGRMTRMCDKTWVNIALDNGLAPNRRQAIIKNNVDIRDIWEPISIKFKSKMRKFHRFMIIWKYRLLFPAKISRPRRVKAFQWSLLLAMFWICKAFLN